jgi:hypothetical protein
MIKEKHIEFGTSKRAGKIKIDSRMIAKDLPNNLKH